MSPELGRLVLISLKRREVLNASSSPSDIVARAHLWREGESVLDVGCGTGTLAIAAKYRVGNLGKATGVDASPEMIGRAKKKARKNGVEVDFQTAAAERLPFQDAAFDVVLSTVMLHHLPHDVRVLCIREIRRVLKPGGRFLAIDFGGSAEQRRSFVGRLHAHANFDLTQVIPLMNQAGLAQVESGPMGFHDMEFVRAAAPATSGKGAAVTTTGPRR